MNDEILTIRRKPTIMTARKVTKPGIMLTKRGLRKYKKGDYIVSAPTGCVWPMTQEHLHNYYDILNQQEN